MNEQIITVITEYIHSYEDLKSSVADEDRLSKLTKVYHELLDIAEKNASSFEKFSKVCGKKDILKRFRDELDCIKEAI